MAILDQILHSKTSKIIGFTGGKGRNFLLNQLASELAHGGKSVIISNIEKDILPPSGRIIYNQDESKLLSEVKKEIKKHPIIYTGRGIQDHFVTGMTLSGIRKLKSEKLSDYLLLLLGNEKKYSLLNPKDVEKLCKMTIIDQLIYCFQLELIDQQFNDEQFTHSAEIIKKFPQHKLENIFSHEFIFDYLTHKENGAYRLFLQKWPTLLILTDVNNIFLENRSINLARDLFSKKIKIIYQANLKENRLKRIPHK
jgi:hypothetical protein